MLLSDVPPADMFEAEPNDSAALANAVPVSATPIIVEGTLGASDAQDWFTFNLSQRSGVFIDVDALEVGLATHLDTILELYDASGTTKLFDNDDGRDFDTLLLNDTSHTNLQFGDSALYADLAAGTYVLKLTTFPIEQPESYQLKFTADATYGGIPVFSSLPGAAHTLYLDFDGRNATDAWNGGAPYSVDAYDFSGNDAEFTPGERRAIENIWRVVADAFSPFDVNVTTSYAGGYTPDATAFRVVIGDTNGSEIGLGGSASGAAFLDSYNSGGANVKTAFVFGENFSDPGSGASGHIVANAIEMGNAAAEQFGRALGLLRYGGTNPQLNGFMQAPDAGLELRFNRERWVSGNTSNAAGEPPVVFQNDLAVITKPANTIVFRADDHGNTRPTATILTASGNAYNVSAIVHQTSDIDVFRFSGSGSTTITLDIPEHLGRLDGELRLFDSAGTLLALSDPADRIGGSISLDLPVTGAYYVEVRSDGGAGEIGQYTVQINTTVPAPNAGGMAGRVFRDVNYDNLYDPAQGDVHLSTTVYIDANNNGVLDDGEQTTTSSAADGTYAFNNLAPSTYRLRQIVPGTYVSDRVLTNTITADGEAFAQRNFGNFPTIFNGTAGNDTFTLRGKAGDASRMEIVQSGAPAVFSVPRSVLTSLTINADAGNDTLVMDYSNNFFVPVAGATFNAGDGADQITYTGSAGQDTINLGVGTITRSGDGTMNYGGVESVTVNANDGQDSISGGTGAAGPSLTVNTGAGDDTTSLSLPSPNFVFNPGTNAAETDSLSIGSGAGDFTFNQDLGAAGTQLTLGMHDPSGSITFNSSQHLKQLTVTSGTVTLAANGNRVLVVGTLSGVSGRLDLKDNDMIVHAAPIGSVSGTSYTGVTGLIASGRNGGNWNGNGIVTTVTSSIQGLTTLAATTAGQLLSLNASQTGAWNGETVEASTILVKYTYAGDANLDGIVSGDDYTAIDFNVLVPGASGYLNGDFNYDGIISGDDYTVIDFNILAQGDPLTSVSVATTDVLQTTETLAPRRGHVMRATPLKSSGRAVR